ncbi:MAG: DUF5107 domain-containing protein, partial [Candidatus Dormibacteria bacterium]
YKNIPVPTSYMVLHSDFDFFGGYDHARAAGFVHIADRQIAPGKKQWTWGDHEFGHAWDRNLTDEDGPYVELMAGVYTDNQPDFSWLQPYETKTFTQLWYPIREIGAAQNANELAAVSVAVGESHVTVGVHASRRLVGCELRLTSDSGEVLAQRSCDLGPDAPLLETVGLPDALEANSLALSLCQDGRELIRHAPVERVLGPEPQPARAMPWPAELDKVEALYLAGLHLEQYRHATRAADPYYREGLARDPYDARCNNAHGLVLLRRGEFQDAAAHFRTAIGTLTQHNPNPADGEPFYNLGVACAFLRRWDAARDALSKATWNQAWAAAGHYGLAQLDCRRKDWAGALVHLDRSLQRDGQNNRARTLRALALRRLGRVDEAAEAAARVKNLDVLDHWSRKELALCLRHQRAQEPAAAEEAELAALMRGQPHSYLDLALAYAAAGAYAEARAVLESFLAQAETAQRPDDPQVLYFLGLFAHHQGEREASLRHFDRAAQAPPGLCFPNRLEAIEALELATNRNPGDARAPYHLGNLLYDKGRREEAIHRWEQARRVDNAFPTVHRNLALGYFNVLRDSDAATQAMRDAVERAPADARILFELDQLLKITGATPAERLELLNQHRHQVEARDDLYLEFVELHNLTGRPGAAIELLRARRFHPWEGGEGRVPEQWVRAHLLAGGELLVAGRPTDARDTLVAALEYPKNLGEGRPFISRQAHVLYALGAASEAAGEPARSLEYLHRAAEEDGPPSELSFFSACALAKLGHRGEARSSLLGLIDHASRLLGTPTTVDYFATSLPTLLVFEDDLDLRKRVRCHHLLGLGQLGLGDLANARAQLTRAVALDPNDLPAVSALGQTVSGEHESLGFGTAGGVD